MFLPFSCICISEESRQRATPFFFCQEKREQHIAQIESVPRSSFRALTYPSICLKTHLCLRLMVVTCFYTSHGNSEFQTTASSLIAAWSPASFARRCEQSLNNFPALSDFYNSEVHERLEQKERENVFILL